MGNNIIDQISPCRIKSSTTVIKFYANFQ